MGAHHSIVLFGGRAPPRLTCFEQPIEETGSPTSPRLIPKGSNSAMPQRVSENTNEGDVDDYEYIRPSELARYDLDSARPRGTRGPRPGSSHPGPRRDWDNESADGTPARPEERPSTYSEFDDWRRRGRKTYDTGSRIRLSEPERQDYHGHSDVLSSGGDDNIESDQNRDRSLGRRNPYREIVMPPKRDGEVKKPIKGILKKPTPKFPEDPNPTRPGVAPHKDDKTKKDAPAEAR
ncbi:hypothetical protein B0T26DRAFT_302066 [Lasiosphaeria miniovina]|uniref:Uncharacterized protein n=1 Tax=Lasiosphaeria miniovina TaxID=1954250 RepID=A0AA40DW04_9PEZI|nr:uncharacterized protein B0T26DRAFT_302066 [Lasiosphaeria miniovina]KAK0717680.1 hypothetical protein B0T26DRAFT_302066 [Lasiosphaeria miniovina]